jgi:septum formation protein
MIILASNSESRAKILKDFGVAFIQKGCDFDEEQIIATSPKNFVYQATMGKFESCKKALSLERPILVADTVVTADNQILRKAKDEEDARRILTLQSGAMTAIITCMIYASKSIMIMDISSTEYHFSKFDEKDLQAYLDSGAWRGKAGACMVEGFCKPYIQKVTGLESNAMGLGIEKILPFI